MGKSKKGFAKINGRKKARLARLDTKKRKLLSKKETRITVKDEPAVTEVVKQFNELEVEQWEDVCTVTTQAADGLSMATSNTRRKEKLLTRRQKERKDQKQSRGERYAQRLLQEARFAAAKRSRQKLASKAFKADLQTDRVN
ncbi:hypothetical protein DIPPA_14553 [Diplonema papillatum]|nr:hypothetical protein DIPPA_14553 [Diplonema papillatum]